MAILKATLKEWGLGRLWSKQMAMMAESYNSQLGGGGKEKEVAGGLPS